MIERIIELSIRNRFVVLVLAGALTVAGIYAVLNTPVDAIPDLSENQVIVFTDWMGRSPREIEDQITYPLVAQVAGSGGRQSGSLVERVQLLDDHDHLRGQHRLLFRSTARDREARPGQQLLARRRRALSGARRHGARPNLLVHRRGQPVQSDRLGQAVGTEQVLYRPAAQRRRRSLGRGHRGRNATRIPGRCPARSAALLRHFAGRPVCGRRQEQYAGRRRRHSEEQRRVHRARRRLDQGQERHREHGHQGSQRNADLRQDRGRRDRGSAVPPQRLREGRQRSRRRGRADAPRRESVGSDRASQGTHPGTATGTCRPACISFPPTTGRD